MKVRIIKYTFLCLLICTINNTKFDFMLYFTQYDSLFIYNLLPSTIYYIYYIASVKFNSF